MEPCLAEISKQHPAGRKAGRTMAAEPKNNDALRMVVVLCIAQGVLTTLHHVYGAVIFDTPQRLHMLMVAPPYAAIVAAAYAGVNRHVRLSQALTKAIVYSSWVLPVGVIGLLEGGYNHLLKSVVFHAGIDPAIFASMYPARLLYERPSDLLFEASGMAQFAVALLLVRPLLTSSNRLLPQGTDANQSP